MAALTFSFTSLTSCEDVPAPYEIPGEDNNPDSPDTPDTPGEGETLPYSDANLKDWNAVTIKGAVWDLGTNYAKATGYNSTDKSYTETEAWLVSPVINITSTTGAVINFDHVIRYVYNTSDINNHEMYISKDYKGDVKTATWTKLDYKPVASTTNTWDFYAASPIAVPQEYLGQKVVVAFKFVCGASNSTTWEIKNFSIKEGTADNPGTGETPGTGDKPGTDDNPGTGSGEVSGNSITVSPASLGLANQTSVGTQTLSDGTQLIFGAGTNKNDPKFYTTGNNIRMYPTNTLTVKSSKKIASIILYCDTYNKILCNAEGNVTANPGTVVVSGEQLNINGINSLETLITNASTITGTASQIRITSIVINYAD